jgi:hypothetical protein
MTPPKVDNASITESKNIKMVKCHFKELKTLFLKK